MNWMDIVILIVVLVIIGIGLFYLSQAIKERDELRDELERRMEDE